MCYKNKALEIRGGHASPWTYCNTTRDDKGHHFGEQSMFAAWALGHSPPRRRRRCPPQRRPCPIAPTVPQHRKGQSAATAPPPAHAIAATPGFCASFCLCFLPCSCALLLASSLRALRDADPPARSDTFQTALTRAMPAHTRRLRGLYANTRGPRQDKSDLSRVATLSAVSDSDLRPM